MYSLRSEVPKGAPGIIFLNGSVVILENWSVNPHWVANFLTMPNHPVTSGVSSFPFTTNGIIICDFVRLCRV